MLVGTCACINGSDDVDGTPYVSKDGDCERLRSPLFFLLRFFKYMIMKPKKIKIEFRNCVNQVVAVHYLEGCGLIVAADYANRVISEYHMILRAVFEEV